MIKLCRIILVLFNILLVAFFLSQLLTVYGWDVNFLTFASIVEILVFSCMAPVYLLPDRYLFRKMNLRKPTAVESEKLMPILRDIQERAGSSEKFRLMVMDYPGLQALCLGRCTLAPSAGMIQHMSDDELSGILAHEIGHHLYNDCITSYAYTSAAFFPWVLTTLHNDILYRWLDGTILGIKKTEIAGILCVAIGLPLAHQLNLHHIMMPVVYIITTVVVAAKLNPSIMFAWQTLCRTNEIKQDAFTFNLGYGGGLKSALQKLQSTAPRDILPIDFHSFLKKWGHPSPLVRIEFLESWENEQAKSRSTQTTNYRNQ